MKQRVDVIFFCSALSFFLVRFGVFGLWKHVPHYSSRPPLQLIQNTSPIPNIEHTGAEKKHQEL